MLSISDPHDLKAADVYRQARTVATKTSRGSDSNWYRDPCEIPWQWHLWFDGGREVCSATFSHAESRWLPGPVLPLASLTTGEGVTELLGELLSPKYFGIKPRAVGVILHVADEFTLAEIAGNTDAAGESVDDFGMLRYNLVDDPREVLADREVSVDTTTWRLLPFWGAGSGMPRAVAVALSRSREAFLSKLLSCGEEWRIPVRAAVTSAPVEALASLPATVPQLSGGCLVALPYLKFTAVFALAPNGELRSARTLSHRGGALVSASFGDILWNMALSAELVGSAASKDGPPRVVLVSTNKAVLEQASQDLELFSASRQQLVFECHDLTEATNLAGLPGHRPEFLVYDEAALGQAKDQRLAKTETFREMWDGWAKQSYFDTGRLDGLYPTLGDLRLLKFTTWLVALLVFVLGGTAIYGTYTLFAAMNHPSWDLTPLQIKRTQENQTKLLAEEKQIDITSRLLLPRSQGWVALEFLMQLFPEETGVRLESYSYQMEANRPGAPVAKGKPAESTGLGRTWSFKGLARSKALERLNNLNSQRGLNALFDKFASDTGDDSYKPDPSRQLRVTLTQNRNARYDAQAAPGDIAHDPSLSFPFTFEATITQVLGDKDKLAMPTDKPF